MSEIGQQEPLQDRPQSIQEKVQKIQEGKYRYLAELARQESPNLRKMYRVSGSQQRSASGFRESPFSSRRRPTINNRLSPSCSTFNPRRQITQEQFSPYDDRAERDSQRMNQQLREENLVLKNQLIQARQSIEMLKGELNRKQGDLLTLRQNNQNDLLYFEKVVSEMTQEIQLVLTKNKILENELSVTKARLLQEEEDRKRDEERRRQEEQRRQREDQRRRQDDERKKREEERRKCDLSREEKREEWLREQRKSVGMVTTQPQSRRSIGKLFSKPLPQRPNNSKIRIEDETENMPLQANCDNRETRKGEELIESIKSMHLKITGNESNSLRSLWKWLKGLGHSQSLLKRWKAKSENMSYLPIDRLRELIKEGCSYIQ